MPSFQPRRLLEQAPCQVLTGRPPCLHRCQCEAMPRRPAPPRSPGMLDRHCSPESSSGFALPYAAHNILETANSCARKRHGLTLNSPPASNWKEPERGGGGVHVSACVGNRAWPSDNYTLPGISNSSRNWRIRARRDPRAEVAQADRGAAAKREMDGAGRVCGRREQGPGSGDTSNPESRIHVPASARQVSVAAARAVQHGITTAACGDDHRSRGELGGAGRGPGRDCS